MYAGLIYVDESMKMSKVSLQTVECDISSPHKDFPRFSSLCFLPPSQPYSSYSYSPHMSLLGKVLLETFRSGECGWMELGRGDQHGAASQAEAKLGCPHLVFSGLLYPQTSDSHWVAFPAPLSVALKPVQLDLIYPPVEELLLISLLWCWKIWWSQKDKAEDKWDTWRTLHLGDPEWTTPFFQKFM